MLDFNHTLIFQMIGFIVLLVILNRFLYRPVQRILDERAERIEGTLKKADETNKEIQDGLDEYEKKIKEARLRGHEERAKLKQEALAREREILDAAGREASKELVVMRRKIGEGKDQALESLKDQTKAISKSMAEKLLDRSVALVLVTGALTLLSSIAFASEAEHGGGGGGAGGLWKVINFVILAVGLYLVWAKVIKKALEKKGEEIKKAMDDAREAKEAAEKRALEYRAKLSDLEKSIAAIAEELRLEGEAEKKKIIAEATSAAVRLAEQARITVEQELIKARIEIRREVAELAARMAGEILSRELKPEDQERLIKEYVSRMRLH
ncbi:MAG TPA: ATP synthase F0 subunit B [Thermodesulfobacteriota bacterium]|nr:ATP synthase F0 subunit B [Thermodesulfobacteriota bacterium]